MYGNQLGEFEASFKFEVTYPCKHQSTVQAQITHARLQNERNMKVKQLIMKIKGSWGSTKFS